MVRLNITLPEDIVKRLKKVRNKSRFIAQVLRKNFQNEERARLQNRLVEEYKSSSQEDQQINQEWEDSTLQEGWD